MNKKALCYTLLLPLLIGVFSCNPSSPSQTPAEVTSFELSGDYKTTYQLGEELDIDGLVLVLIYSDGSRKNVTDYTVSGYDKNKEGKQNLTINYDGKTYNLTIYVQGEGGETINIVDAERIYISNSAVNVIEGMTYALNPVLVPNDSYENVKYIIDNE